ncbi:copper-translocating P-type ATPase [Vibrio atypicus]|uniref:copper-translocating P-type ATPase n=1 Tax=Vibrio atypicus TaxID=558271 RepID=UPI0013581362|nr:copper-translocating P-type ATPase [Vibrio atypicus]
MIKFDIPLAGLNCMGCARKVETALIEQHQAIIHDLSPTYVSFESASTFHDIEKSISSLGYQAGHQHHFFLSGLNCGKCVSKLTKVLENNALIGQFSASKTELLVSTLLSEEQVKSIILDLGYTASAKPLETSQSIRSELEVKKTSTNSKPVDDRGVATHMLISGMTCASCVASIEQALLLVPQVNKVQISLAEQSALIISSESNPISGEALIAAVKEAGYVAEIIDDPETQQQKQNELLIHNQRHFKRSAWAGMLIGGPLMLWGIAGGNMMIHSSQDQLAWGIVGIICLILLATSGRSFFVNAWQALTHKRATMDTLVALGTGSAWLFSMLVVTFPQWFPAESRHVYFEASAMIVGLISLGHYIEARAKAKTTRSLQALINLQPNGAIQVTDQGDQPIEIKAITLGMHLRIKPGEKAPVDGNVLSGDSYIDESMLTGEAIPVFKKHGDHVSAGTLNQDGSLIIEATGVGSNTMLSRIISMVKEAQSSKPAIAKLADQISSVFVPVVVAIAILSGLVWFIFGPEPKASYTLIVTTTVLIIACPCALGLATPLSVTVGVGKAAELGILIRDAEVLQSASKINTVVFDKTGTLTQGKPRIQMFFPVNVSKHQLLALAAGVEQHSEHPLAKAIVQHANKEGVHLAKIDNFENQRGKGVSGLYQNKTISVVSLQVAEENQWDLSQLNNSIIQCQEKAWTPIIVALDNQPIGLLAISDPIKPDAFQAIANLQKVNITPVMLTGDNHYVANAIAKQLGIEQIISQVLPDEKAKHIADLQLRGQRVAMVGDGVNDAPALALADVGIAMASGSDVAIESAQMTLLNSSPLAVVNAIELSKATVKNMKQNLFGAFIYNSLGIPIAAGVLYPAFGFMLNPVVAGAAMALSSITVVSNANRLRLFKTSSRP